MAIAADMPAAGHPDIEAWLDERRVAWTYHPQLAVDQVDRLAGLNNQARLEPLSDEVVDRYAADMERGDQFPPIIVRRVGKKLVPIGGNHRLAAAGRAKRAALAAYEIVCEPETALRLSYEDNRRHGLPPSEDERLAQAVHLVGTGYTHAQAAEVCGVHRSKLGAAIARQRADQRALDLGVKGWGTLTKGIRARFENVRSDPVFKEAAQLAVDARMSPADVERLVGRINQARSDADALALVGIEAEQQAAAAQQTANGTVRKTTARSKLLTSMGGVLAADPQTVRQSCATDDQRRQLRARVTDALTKLAEIHKALA